MHPACSPLDGRKTGEYEGTNEDAIELVAVPVFYRIGDRVA
jgi:hypothetical protein